MEKLILDKNDIPFNYGNRGPDLIIGKHFNLSDTYTFWDEVCGDGCRTFYTHVNNFLNQVD